MKKGMEEKHIDDGQEICYCKLLSTVDYLNGEGNKAFYLMLTNTREI